MQTAFDFIVKADKQEFEGKTIDNLNGLRFSNTSLTADSEAREIVPEIVECESKFMDFLRCENMDPFKAAKRVAAYWKCRKILFAERWLLPMNQTGTGTLSMEDIEILRMGSRVIFRRLGQGFFAIVDESRLTRPPGNSIFRLMLYMAIPFCDEATQIEGTTVVHIVNSQPRQPPNLDRIMFDLVKAGLPTTLKAYHVVQAYEEGRNEYMDFLGFKEAKIAQFRVRADPNLVVADSVHGTWTKLNSLGFKQEHLPRCVGGTYDYSQFAEWTRARISVEDMMSSTPLMANRLTVVSTRRVDAPIRRRSGSGGETQEEVRLRNAIKSRRSYHRRKLEEFSLREHQRVWEIRNEPIRKQNALLEGMLAQGQAIVKLYTGQEHVFQQN